jgi:hypothetical protein
VAVADNMGYDVIITTKPNLYATQTVRPAIRQAGSNSQKRKHPSRKDTVGMPVRLWDTQGSHRRVPAKRADAELWLPARREDGGTLYNPRAGVTPRLFRCVSKLGRHGEALHQRQPLGVEVLRRQGRQGLRRVAAIRKFLCIHGRPARGAYP